MSRKHDKIVEDYLKMSSVKQVARCNNISAQKVRRILIIEGFIETETSKKVKELYDSNYTISEISKRLGIGEKAVNSYLPYIKTEYNTEDPSVNAKKLRKWRQQKKPSNRKDHSAEEVKEQSYD